VTGKGIEYAPDGIRTKMAMKIDRFGNPQSAIQPLLGLIRRVQMPTTSTTAVGARHGRPRPLERWPVASATTAVRVAQGLHGVSTSENELETEHQAVSRPAPGARALRRDSTASDVIPIQAPIL
jgi:hypothetical protein